MLSLQAAGGEDAGFCGIYTPNLDANVLPNASEEFMLCRFCAQMKNYDRELLDLSLDRKAYEEYVRMLDFFKIDYIPLSEDNLLPKTSCEQCYNSFQAAYKFFVQVKQSQITLNNVYNGTSCGVKLEPQIEETHESLNQNLFMSSMFTKKKKLKSENDFDLLSKASILPEPPIHIPENDVIPTPSFGDLISDDIDPKLADTDMENSDTDNDDIITNENNVKALLPLYGGIPIFDNDKLKVHWANYLWICSLCDKKCLGITYIRYHAMTMHKTCAAFTCVDCKDEQSTFTQFIEHVRTHRTHLRNYCKYCDREFESEEKCMTHEKDHELYQIPCDLCGELCSNEAALIKHKEPTKHKEAARHKEARHRSKDSVYQIKRKKKLKVIKKVRSRRYDKNCTWDNYEWTCQECCQRSPTVASLRDHIQNVHNKCFAMKCVDCLQVMTNFRMFAEHVKKHRPYLKNYCQYCNEPFPDQSLAPQHIEDHLNNSELRPCDGCGQIFTDIDQLTTHMKKYESPRRRGTIRTEDLTCDVCQKVCQSLNSFRLHRKTHDEQRKRDYTCDSCGKSFYTAGMLKEHIKTHDVKTEVCEICKKTFHTKPKLKAHVATHSALRPYTCNECGKSFRTVKRLKVHCLLHTDIKPFKCLACGKEFRYKIGLKVHENQHTGLRPYPCERCEKAFANWANCNKHMIRKHGVTLAKTKLTALGRLAINRETGQPANISSDEHAREWMDKLINVKRGKKEEKTDLPSTS